MTRSPLFPETALRESLDRQLTRRLSVAARRVAAGDVTPTADMGTFRQALAEIDFAHPRDLDSLADWVIGEMERGLVQMTHRRYFGLYNPAPAFASEYADRIAAAFNPQLAVWSHASVAVEIERHLIHAIASRAGLPESSSGHFTSGGAEANFTSLICALTRTNPSFGSEGVRAFAGPPTLYASADSHLAWLKIAHQTGIGRQAVRLIATDGTGRMDADALARAVREDVAAGRVPVMIAATAGTTNAGMIDPLRVCRTIADEHGLWLHVDAAWAGAMIASPKLASKLDGMETADSITIDAHKWFAATMGCGMFLTRHPSMLSTAFQVAASYMPSNLEAVDPYVTSAQWSRRFLGLRLFLPLAQVGWVGYAAHVERAIALLERLAETMRSDGWIVANDPSAGVLCLRPPEGAASAKEVVETIVDSGAAWVSVARLEGQDVVRVCVTNGRSDEKDIAELGRLLTSGADGS